MHTDRAPLLLHRILESGTIDEESGAWIVESLARWLDGEPWPQCACLPSPDRTRQAVRDDWIQQAATYLTGTPWQRAKQLCVIARRFESQQWPRWRNGALPPTDDEVLACLFFACRACRDGATLPGTAQGFLKALTKNSGFVSGAGNTVVETSLETEP